MKEPIYWHPISLGFYETYRRSSLAEEAQFMYAYSLYVSSPAYSLDQQSSIEAMNAMQTFINQYPRSKYLDQAVNVIEDTQVKLERKGYENAKLYLKLKSYKAAILSFDNFKSSFPDSEYLEELSFLKVEAQFRFAEQSFLNLQNERYSLVVEFYHDFVDNFPKSLYIKDAEKYYQNSVEKINKLKTNNS
ncbi:MAG: outer membrane protein assembly factor BamD [Flammeovirgaceae bacterium]|nr:outer membrane protein assembly factor BamD [Flammeovirgaceae bacterium]